MKHGPTLPHQIRSVWLRTRLLPGETITTPHRCQRNTGSSLQGPIKHCTCPREQIKLLWLLHYSCSKTIQLTLESQQNNDDIRISECVSNRLHAACVWPCCITTQCTLTDSHLNLLFSGQQHLCCSSHTRPIKHCVIFERWRNVFGHRCQSKSFPSNTPFCNHL